MQRRELLKFAALTAGATTARRALGGTLFTPDSPNTAVRRVLVAFKCHLDVGFTNTQAAVMRKYFDVYYPQAIETGAALRRAGGDRYTWTTGSWLLYEYLEQANAEQRRAMEQSIAAGDISWHALPFSWQTEMLDRSMIDGALSLSRSLDARFGHKTIGAKMTDVPGHTRGIIAPLAAAGVTLLDIGVNGASTPPDVPDVFLWKSTDGSTLPMIYHRHDYGGTVVLPGTDTAFSMEMRGDNDGPHSQDEIRAIYTRLRQQFPGATISAATLSDVAAALAPVRDKLPVVTDEIGDTWIYGIPSDPPKVARYREAARLRQEWIAQNKLEVGGEVDRALLRRMTLSVEHTWGTDTKRYLDPNHYKPADLTAVLGEPGYRTMEASWQEKRDDLFDAMRRPPRTHACRHGAAVGDAERQRSQPCRHASACSPAGARHRALPHCSRSAHRRHHRAHQQDDRARVGIAEKPARPLHLSNAGPGSIRRLYCRVPDRENRVGTSGLRQTQPRALRRSQPRVAPRAASVLGKRGLAEASPAGGAGHRRSRECGGRSGRVARLALPRHRYAEENATATDTIHLSRQAAEPPAGSHVAHLPSHHQRRKGMGARQGGPARTSRRCRARRRTQHACCIGAPALPRRAGPIRAGHSRRSRRRPRRAVTARLLARAAHDGGRHPHQPLQQRLGHQLSAMVRR